MQPIVYGTVLLTLEAFCAVPAFADQKADTLLAEVKAAYKSAKTMTATSICISHTSKGEQQLTDTLKMQKPDKFSDVSITNEVSKSITGVPISNVADIMVSDGTTRWMFDPTSLQYTKRPSFPGDMILAGEDTVVLFFNPGISFPDPAKPLPEGITATSSYIGTKRVGEVVCQVIILTYHVGLMTTRREMYIGPDKLVHRVITRTKFPGKPAFDDVTTITNIKIDPALTDADFTFLPPAGAKEVKELK